MCHTLRSWGLGVGNLALGHPLQSGRACALGSLRKRCRTNQGGEREVEKNATYLFIIVRNVSALESDSDLLADRKAAASDDVWGY